MFVTALEDFAEAVQNLETDFSREKCEEYYRLRNVLIDMYVEACAKAEQPFC